MNEQEKIRIPKKGEMIVITQAWSDDLPAGTNGIVTQVGRRPNDVRFINIQWQNGVEKSYPDSIYFNNCQS